MAHVRPGTGRALSPFDGDDSRDLTSAVLERQLGRALRHMPRMRRGESMPVYLARQQAHIASRPDLFTPSVHRRPPNCSA